MNYIISGKNIEVTEGLRNAVQDKLSKLEKYLRLILAHRSHSALRKIDRR